MASKEALIVNHQQSIQKVRDEMKQTHRLYLDGHVRPQGCGDFYKPAEERLNQLTAELPKLQAQVDLLKVNSLSVVDIMAQASTLYNRWPKLPLDDRRKIAEAVCEKIVIGEGEIDITYSCLPLLRNCVKSNDALLALDANDRAQAIFVLIPCRTTPI